MTPQNLPSLTSMRFFAALMVALFHACVWSSVPLGPFRYGFVGVTFFYILSGFVLTWTWRPHDSLRFFYLRRFARVYPLHLLTAMIALALAALGVRGEGEVSPLTALLNLALLQAWVPDLAVVGALNGPSWSLSNEAFFYAVFPLLVGLLLSARLGPAIGVLGALGWLVVGGLVTVRFFPNLDWFLYVSPLYRLGEFAVGMGLALAVQRGTRIPVPLWAAVMAAGSGYLALWFANRLTGGFVDEHQGACHLVVLPGFALLIVSAAARDATGARGVLHHRWLVRLGQWSFALYLVHVLLLRVAQPAFSALRGDFRALLALAVVAGAILVSAVLYEWFERPIEKRIRAWGHQRESMLARSVDRVAR